MSSINLKLLQTFLLAAENGSFRRAAEESNRSPSAVSMQIRDLEEQIGISLFIRTSQRDVFRSRAIGGEIMMAVWNGIDNGVPTADMNPGQLAPTMDSQLQWPVWGLYFISNGEKGEAPDMPEVAQQMERLRKWRASRTLEERTAAWHEMLAAFTDQVFSIGLVNQALQPVVATRKMRNIPETGLFGFEPTCFLGVYMPDTFWLDEEG